MKGKDLLEPTGNGDYIVWVGKYAGKLLSWVVQHDSYYLIEKFQVMYPEMADIVWNAVTARDPKTTWRGYDLSVPAVVGSHVETCRDYCRAEVCKAERGR